MNWIIQWLHDARDELADAWLQADDRAAVTQAMHNAERNLAQQGNRDAHLVAEDLWRLDAPPLAVYFTVHDQNRIVEISSIRLAQGGSPGKSRT